MKKRNVGVYLLAIILCFSAIGGFTVAMTEVGPNDIIEELKLFSKALGAIMEGYVKDVNAREMLYEAVKGMLASLDPYCQFIGKENYSLLKIDMSGEYSGIGAALELVDEVISIKEIQVGSPAEKAGLQIHDKIFKIDGDPTKGKTIADVASLLRGDVATPVTLTVWREVMKKMFDITVIREKVEIKAVNDIRTVGKAAGYFRIDNFQENTPDQLDKAIKSLTEKGAKAFIIDLRNNEGGLMSVAIQVAERFLSKDTPIVSVDSKIDVQKQKHVSSGEKKLGDFPLILLVNERSASASEIFSAAIQDNRKGTIVGKKTFGKASVQSVIPLDEQTAMKLTTARYLSPSGRVIDGVGIEPDVVVEYQTAGSKSSDEQIEKALELFKEYL